MENEQGKNNMVRLLLTRVSCQSGQANAKCYHVLNKNYKIHMTSGTGLFNLSSKKIPHTWMIIEIPELMYKIFHQRNRYGYYDSSDRQKRTLGRNLLRGGLIRAYKGEESEIKIIAHD